MIIQVSVVMSTYGDAEHLSTSIDSVLEQDFRDFELIVVNDGSPDPYTRQILEDYAVRDSRLQIITKENGGLTKALIDGCAVARGKYIARIDVGDRYLPGRLSAQHRFMEPQSGVALCSCWTRFVDDDGFTVIEVCREDSPEQARASLRSDRLSELKGLTSHGSVMFRRDAYIEAGGYRPEFFFAQDMDLWSRVTDRHGIAFLPQILHEVTFSPSGISGLYSREQRQLAELMIAMRRCRVDGLPESELLRSAAAIRPRIIQPLAPDFFGPRRVLCGMSTVRP